MLVYTLEKIRHLLKIDFIRFCIVGGTGFVINFIVLLVLGYLFNLPIFFAQLIGAEIALASNFTLHHNWTYRSNKVHKSIWTLIVQFHASSWPAIVGSALMVHAGVRYLHLSDVMALAATAPISLVWNFGWSKFIIWKNITPKEVEEIAK